MARSPTRDPEDRRGRFEIRWVLTLVILLVVAGAAWTAMNGRDEPAGAATPDAADWPRPERDVDGRPTPPLPQP